MNQGEGKSFLQGGQLLLWRVHIYGTFHRYTQTKHALAGVSPYVCFKEWWNTGQERTREHWKKSFLLLDEQIKGNNQTDWSHYCAHTRLLEIKTNNSNKYDNNNTNNISAAAWRQPLLPYVCMFEDLCCLVDSWSFRTRDQHAGLRTAPTAAHRGVGRLCPYCCGVSAGTSMRWRGTMDTCDHHRNVCRSRLDGEHGGRIRQGFGGRVGSFPKHKLKSPPFHNHWCSGPPPPARQAFTASTPTPARHGLPPLELVIIIKS